MKIVIPDALKRRFKKACVDHDSSMSDVVCSLVEAWLAGKVALDADSEHGQFSTQGSEDP